MTGNMKKWIWLFACLAWCPALRSQVLLTAPHAHEFSFTTDNDAYLFQKKDAYYTNGFFFNWRAAFERKGVKNINTYELGQMIYTPLIRKSASTADIDRPYCGYLFFRYDRTRFPDPESVLQLGGSVGVVGPESKGEEVQNDYHQLLGYSRFAGWQYQVQDAIGIDLSGMYAKTVWQDSSWIKLVPFAQANLGMNMTNAQAGVFLCIGLFESNANSALFNARVQAKQVTARRKGELFLFWNPKVIAQGFNSTVQGGLFDKGYGAVLKDLKPWMYQQAWGLCYARGRISVNVSVIYQTRECAGQTLPQRYASVQLSYRMY